MAVLNLCAGAGDVLLALDVVGGENYVAAVEPDALRRTVLSYRLLAHWSAEEMVVCTAPEDLDGVWLPTVHPAVSGTQGFPPADLVVADPPTRRESRSGTRKVR